MANPLVTQGSLNRLIGSVVIPDFPALNITAPFLGDEGISVALQGDTTTFINTLTGAVTSPEPYQGVQISAHLLKTQYLSIAYKLQIEADARIGDLTLILDSFPFPPYHFTNCAIQSVGELRLNGRDAGYRITIGGYYYINNNMWGLVT